MDLAPHLASCHWASGYGWLARGQYQDAIAAMKQATQLDPLSAPISMALCNAYYLSRDYDRAVKTCRETIDLDPLFAPAYHALPMIYAKMGLFQEAFSTLQHFLDSKQLDQNCVPITRALISAIAGEANEARSRLSELETEGTVLYSHGLQWVRAALYANLGELDKALDVLEHCYQERLPGLTFLAGQPELEWSGPQK